MQRSSRHPGDEAARRLLGAALLVALMFRLMAGPALMAPPSPGLVPICAGDKIVYLALHGGAETPAPKAADPCPVFGLALAALAAEVPDPMPRQIAFAACSVDGEGLAWPVARPSDHRPRAPPAASATV